MTKVNSLEGKIKGYIKYLIDTLGWGFDENDIYILTKGIAEICEKEYELYMKDWSRLTGVVAELEKENAELKQQLHDTPKEYNNAFKALAKKRREHINYLAELLHKKNKR